MSAIEVRDLSFAFGKADALHNVSFDVPAGALYALLGPNGAGKSTLFHILMGFRDNYTGHARILGQECSALAPDDRRHIGYVAEGQQLPGWMRLEQLEAYLAPWYPNWDSRLANELRDRFDLDPTQKIDRLSRGQYMKAAMLCALAPRPRVLLMDEPFTGMDVVVKDDLVRGLLAASAADGCTIVLSSHDIAEIEMLADHVGFLQNGSLKISETMESVRERFKHIDVILPENSRFDGTMPTEWWGAERAGRRIEFVMSAVGEDVSQLVASRFPAATRIDSRQATLKELFVAMQHSHKPASKRDSTMETPV